MSTNYKDRIRGLVIILLCFIVLFEFSNSLYIRAYCEENNICYELVAEVAENSQWSEEEVAVFFRQVSPSIEAYEAIQLLCPEWNTDEINAVMMAAALKEELNEK